MANKISDGLRIQLASQAFWDEADTPLTRAINERLAYQLNGQVHPANSASLQDFIDSVLAMSDEEIWAAQSAQFNWPGEVAAIWARLYRDRPDDAMEMCKVLTTDAQREAALRELDEEDERDA